MPYYLSKVLPLLLLPVPLGLLLVLLAAVLIWRRRPKVAVGSLIVALGVLWISSIPHVASRLLWTLQKQHLPVDADAIPRSDCIIVLGGVLGDAAFPRVEVELSEAIDRVYQAARLYRLGKAKAIIVAAGNQPWNRDLEPEANLIRDLLGEWGVPASAVSVDTASRNTRENAVNALPLIRDRSCESILLVTSAWHMPRAAAAFAVLGRPVFPVPVDVRGVQGSGDILLGLIPRADALAVTSQVILEWMGIWTYRWRGWN